MKELTIKLRLDRSHERQQTAAAMADSRALERQHKQTADTAKKSAKDAANAAKQASKEAAAAAKQAAKESSDAARSYADETKKRQREMVAAAKQAAKDQAAAEKAAAEATKKSAAMAAKAKIAAYHEADAEFKKSIQAQNEGLSSNTIAIGKAALAYGAFEVAAKVVGSIAEMWRNQRKDIEDSVQRMGQYRNIVLELATLNDRLGRTTPELKNQLMFRASTLQGKTDAIAFQGGAMDTGQAAMKAGLITPGEFKKLSENMGSFQGATGAEPAALGSLTGMMPGLMGGKNLSAEEVTRNEIGIMDILRLGNGGLKTGVGQFAANGGLTKAGMFAPGGKEQAALQAYFSLNAADSAGTLVDQFVRGTVGMTTKARGSALEGSETQVEYGKSLGVTDAMKPLEIGRLIAADLKKQRQAAGPDFNAKGYLTRHGITDQYAQDALLDFGVGVNTGAFKPFADLARPEATPTFAAAMRETDTHKAVDPTAQGRKAELATQLADANRGTGSEEMFDNAKRIAFENLRLQGKTYGKYEDQNGSRLWEGQILDEVQRMTAEAMKSVGLDPSAVGDRGEGSMAGRFMKSMGVGQGHGVLGGVAGARLAYSNETRAKAYGEFSTQIREKGGDPLAILAEMLATSRKQLELTEKMENRAASGVPNRVAAPAPAPPPAPLRGAPPVPVR